MISIQPISCELARPVIEKNHYSHAWTASSLCFGIYDDGFQTNSFFEAPELLGAIVYGHPVGRQVVNGLSPLLKNGEVWELKRLWVDDRLGKNTESKVIAMSIDYIRQHHPEIKCLISYADPQQGHNGMIYQASNWLCSFCESTPSKHMHYLSFDDGRNWIHPRAVNEIYGSCSLIEIMDKLPRPFLARRTTRKHRYLYPMGNKIFRKQLIKSLKHPIVPYPERTEKAEVVIEKYD